MLDWQQHFVPHVRGLKNTRGKQCSISTNFMGKAALSEITSSEFLKHVWNDMLKQTPKRKRDGYGVDYVSINRFESAQKKNLSYIAQAVRNNIYKPSTLKPYFIPKPNNKERVICVPTIEDRLIQRCILQYLNDKGYTLNNDISYGFVKGKASAVKGAGIKATKYRNILPWAYKADISAFFDTIDRDLLKSIVSKKVRTKSLHKLINLSIDTEISAPSKKIRKKIESKGIKTGVGLRQGMPISPYLANLYLSAFDKEVINQKIPMVRYADDLIAFGESETACREIHEFCVYHLSKLGLNIHNIQEGSKTEIVRPEETVEFLGLGLSKKSDGGYHLIVTKNQLNSIKQNLLELSKLEYCQNNKITISKLLRKLDAKIDSYDSAYDICANKIQLLDSLRDYRTLVLERLLTNNFNIDVGSLTKRQKWFLELESL